MSISFKLPYPDNKSDKARFCKQYGLNSIYAGKHWRKRNDDKECWSFLVKSQLKRQKVRQCIFSTPVIITFCFNDGLDIDNHGYMTKMTIDALKGYLLVDDSRKYVVGVCQFFHDEDHILVEVTT